MSAPLTTDFDGKAGTLSMWVQGYSSDGSNPQPFDYNLFHVQAQYAGDIFRLDLRIPDLAEAKPDALTVDYVKVGVSTNTISNTDFHSTDLQHVVVTWQTGSSDMSGLKLYVNSTTVATIPATDMPAWTTSAPSPFEVTIGPANHNINHVVLWKSVLDSNDVQAIYAAGTAANAATMALSIGASGTGINFYNPSGSKLYLTQLQLKGKRIKRYRAVTNEAVDATSRDQHGAAGLDWDMPYESSPTFIRTWSDWLLSMYKNPSTRVESVTFSANRSDAIFKQALALEPGDRIIIREAQTGLDASFYVNGLSYKATGKDTLQVTVYVIAAEVVAGYWNLAIEGMSNIGVNTWLSL